jgi:molecular chaperone GrpE (heat shock protein)
MEVNNTPAHRDTWDILRTRAIMRTHGHKSTLARAFDDPAQEEGDTTSGPVQTEAGRVAGERSELLARKYGGQQLSESERERLELLTERLKELLPPVSVGDLESLLSLTEELERIRERAQERRQRLGLS